jgi:hypothetical protein
MTGEIRVLIVDSTINRGHALAGLFAEKRADVCHLVFLKGNARFTPESMRGGEFELALIHGGDYQRLCQHEQSGGIRIGRRVYYGGAGGADSRIPRDGERIWKVMEGSGGLLSEKECVDLLEAARNLAFAPPILQRGVNLPVLRVLGVLSLLHIAVHAANTVGLEDVIPGTLGELERKSFERLGWFQMALGVRQKLTLQPDSLPRYDADVKSREWWVAQLELAGGKEWRQSFDSELTKAECRGVTETAELSNLVAAICQPDREPAGGFVSQVMKAYLALAELREW